MSSPHKHEYSSRNSNYNSEFNYQGEFSVYDPRFANYASYMKQKQHYIHGDPHSTYKSTTKHGQYLYDARYPTLNSSHPNHSTSNSSIHHKHQHRTNSQLPQKFSNGLPPRYHNPPTMKRPDETKKFSSIEAAKNQNVQFPTKMVSSKSSAPLETRLPTYSSNAASSNFISNSEYHLPIWKIESAKTSLIVSIVMFILAVILFVIGLALIVLRYVYQRVFTTADRGEVIGPVIFSLSFVCILIGSIFLYRAYRFKAKALKMRKTARPNLPANRMQTVLISG